MSLLKFQLITSFYPSYLNFLYRKYPDLILLNYQDQNKKIFDDFFSWGNAWKINLEKTGLFKAENIILNAVDLQKRWCIEQNTSFDRLKPLETVKKQIIQYQPDVLFLHNYTIIDPQFRNEIKKLVPNIKIIIGWDGEGRCSSNDYYGCDMILSCANSILKYYTKNKFRTYKFDFGFEKSILEHIETQSTKKVSFIGSVTIGSNMYKTRLRILGELIKTIPANYYISSLTEDKTYFIKCLLKKVKNAEWQDLRDIFRLINNNKGQAFGLEMFKILAEHKININTHGDIVKNEAANIRLFEATGVGTCLVTDWKENLSEFFEPDQEVVTYKSVPEAIEKIKYLLDHEEERKKIAAAGQKRTLENYSYEKRIKDFSDFLLTQLT